jgi:hypothetical protein
MPAPQVPFYGQAGGKANGNRTVVGSQWSVVGRESLFLKSLSALTGVHLRLKNRISYLAVRIS